jgi:hypothetical protein
MPSLNRKNISDELGIDFVENNVYMNCENELEYDNSSTEEILRKNISRANRILDRVEFEMNNGNFQARLVEVAGQLINSVSTAVANLNLTEYNLQYLELRNRIVSLKEFEVKLKERNSSGVTNQNIIVTDRETILRMLENKKDTKLLEEGEN